MKPLILLDVDGVVNGTSVSDRIVHDGFTDFVRTALGNDVPFDVTYSNEMIKRINGWSEKASIVWLTSWGTHAKNVLAPPLGLNPFDVHVQTKTDVMSDTILVRMMVSCGELNIKNHAFLEKQFGLLSVADMAGPEVFQRPTVWIDDHLGTTKLQDTCKILENVMGDKVLFIDPRKHMEERFSTMTVLTPKLMDEVDAFLDKHAAAKEE